MRIGTNDIKKLLALVRKKYSNWQGFDDKRFVKDEIDYKFKAVDFVKEKLSEQELNRMIEEGNALEIFKRLHTVGKHKNLLWNAIPQKGDLRILPDASRDPEGFARAIVDLLYGDGETPDRLDRFIEHLKSHDLPVYWTFPTYFLFLRYPETEIFVKPSDVSWLLKFLGMKDTYASDPSGALYTTIKNVVLDLKDALSEFNPRTMVDIQSFIWVAFDVRRKSKGQVAEIETLDAPEYWKIAPGENASIWEECRDGGYIAVGWDETGDVSQMSEEVFEDKCNELIAAHPEWTKTRLRQVWRFAHIPVGSLIVANKGTTQTVGFGRVTEEYRYARNESYPHRLSVDWFDVEPRSITEGGFRKTLVKLNKKRFEQLINAPYDEDTPDSPPPLAPPHPMYTREDALRELFIEEDTLNEILALLRTKKNIILQGPPGVGKTFAAKRIAWVMLGRKNDYNIETVQFHQSYSYEDFVQGIRPDDSGNFKLENGLFMDFCQKASEKGNEKFVLIIDEINRGNLSKIFGELMLLLEADKRGEKVTLTYSSKGETFTVPPNVHLIGTMNTADRSLAMVDYALRRRFCFISLEPAFPPSANVEKFRKHLKEAGVSQQIVARIISKMNSLNEEIRKDTKSLGPGFQIGHSYFCADDGSGCNDEWYRRVITYEIAPLLREYWFDNLEIAEKRIRELLGE